MFIVVCRSTLPYPYPCCWSIYQWQPSTETAERRKDRDSRVHSQSTVSPRSVQGQSKASWILSQFGVWRTCVNATCPWEAFNQWFWFSTRYVVSSMYFATALIAIEAILTSRYSKISSLTVPHCDTYSLQISFWLLTWLRILQLRVNVGAFLIPGAKF